MVTHFLNKKRKKKRETECISHKSLKYKVSFAVCLKAVERIMSSAYLKET